MSQDPIFPISGPNPYTYVMNNPLRFIDPRGLAPGDIYPTESGAGNAAINDINPTSIGIGQEFGGTIYQNADGTYSYSPPQMLGPAGGSIQGPANSCGMYHTHGSNDPGYYNNYFSDTDANTSNQLMINSYLGTPTGPNQSYSPYTGGLTFY